MVEVPTIGGLCPDAYFVQRRGSEVFSAKKSVFLVSPYQNSQKLIGANVLISCLEA
jgi:hypothetical protein